MTKTILCYGDSNTHGTPAMPEIGSTGRFPKDQRWPGIMSAKLGDGYDVIAEGLPGRNTCFDDPIEGEGMNGLRLIPAILRTHQPIDLVIVMLGTNDLKARFHAPAQDIALGVEKIVTAIQQSPYGPQCNPPKVLVVSPVPIIETGCFVDMFRGGEAKARALPDHLRKAALRRGVDMVDLAEITRVDPVDGIHLTTESHAAIGAAITGKVKEILA